MNLRLFFPALTAVLTLWLLTPAPALAWLGPICDHGVIHHLEQGQPGATDTAFFDYLATHQGSFEMQEGDVCLPPATPDPTPTRTPTPVPSPTPTSPAGPAPSSTSGTNSGSASIPTPTAMSLTSSATIRPGTGSTSGPPVLPGGMSSNASNTSAGGTSPGADNSKLITICDRQPGGMRTIQIHEEQLPAYRRELVNEGPCRTSTATPTSTGTTTAATPRLVATATLITTLAPSVPIPSTTDGSPTPTATTEAEVVSDATPAPERVASETERPALVPLPMLLPRTGAGGAKAVTPTMWLVAGGIVAAAAWYGRRRC